MNLVHDSIPFELDDVLQRHIEFILMNKTNRATRHGLFDLLRSV